MQLKEAKCEVEVLKLKLTLRSSFWNLKLSKLMSRSSTSPPRNLTMCCPLKNLHMIRLVWAIPEKEV